ncbi:Endopolyphosphatase [Peltigera leucophlebia]|nr:Endopolyphosphatase [Peltigera leucophlebia]
MDPGPNRWTKSSLRIWRKFIPEEQRHSFERGGWFFAEVIPNKLAAFNLNTLYFFSNNAAVDGCADKSEIGSNGLAAHPAAISPTKGYEGIIMGHVPPARTDAKQSWDDTCWQKYTLWMYQYRDVVVGSLYGHMNIEHFLLQDSEEVNGRSLNCDVGEFGQTAHDDEMTIQSTVDYLSQLWTQWSRLPYLEHVTDSKKEGKEEKPKNPKKKKKSEDQKYYKKIGGEWGERYSLSLISASVVPNYFPTI